MQENAKDGDILWEDVCREQRRGFGVKDSVQNID
jgi:hypothetical protein